MNSMSMGGLAIAIGALVDDAMLTLRNVMRRLRENARAAEGERLPCWTLCIRASSEIRGSVRICDASSLSSFSSHCFCWAVWKDAYSSL